MNTLKANKFRVGDEVEIVKLDKTIQHFGGVSALAPVGTKALVTWVDVTGEEVEIDEDTYSYHASDLVLVNDKEETSTSQPIQSDGGSSDYYFTKLPQELIDQIVKTGGIEIKDIARYVYDNNADAFNIVKAQKRIVESLKGKGKAGITSLYDANKIRFFAEEQYNALNNKES